MEDECRRLVDDELINTCNGMRANDRTRVTEKLNELWNEDIEWTVEGIRVQLIRAILTNLVKCTKGTLHHVVHVYNNGLDDVILISPTKRSHKHTSPTNPSPPSPSPQLLLSNSLDITHTQWLTPHTQWLGLPHKRVVPSYQ